MLLVNNSFYTISTAITFVLLLTTASHEAVILKPKSIVMKKLQTVLAATLLLFATSAFAAGGPEKVSPKVKAEFEKSFTRASNVSWEKSDDIYFANFELDAKEVSAAYNETGELLGISRVIATTQLPLNITMAVTGKYQGYNVATTVTEMTYEGQTSYFVTVENDKQVLKLKCTATGEISVDRKNKK